MAAILRNAAERPDFRSGDWVFQPSLHRAVNGGEVVRLEPKLVGVLLYLVQRAGQTVSKDELLAAVWPDTVVEEVALARSISELRRLLHDDARSPRYVETISKLGYRWIAGVSDIESAEPLPPQKPPRRALWVIATTAASAAVLITAAAVRQHAASHLPATLAVLPFTNLSGMAADDYLADGVTEQLTTDLARLRIFRVTSRTSAMTYKATKKPVPRIAQELGVEALVEGSVLRAGDKLRVTAQFIDARTDKHLFSQTYDSDVRSILALQNVIARDIAFNRDGNGPRAIEPQAANRNLDAYRAYIGGEYFLNKRGKNDLLKSVDEFRRALDADPTSAAAYAGLASAYAQIGYFNYLAPNEAFPKAKAAATRALELDPGSAEAHASLGYIHMYYDWDFARAESEFRKAIAQNPSLAIAHHDYAVYLAAMLRPVEAEREMATAHVIDPLSVLVATDMGFVLYYDRSYARAASALRDAITMNPNASGAHFWLGRVYQAEKRDADAAAEYRAGGPGISQWPPALGGLGHMYGILGEKAKARNVLNELALMSKTQYVTPYAATLVDLGLSQKEQTLAMLERCFDERANWLVWLLKDPRWDTMRSDPRFQEIVKRVGFPADARERANRSSNADPRTHATGIRDREQPHTLSRSSSVRRSLRASAGAMLAVRAAP